jgi:holo-[acyl-carrier protein] synthase
VIFGIGTDIVSISRIEQGIERHGDRFAQRILADSELEGFHAAVRPASYLAKRFAAKEAMAKAMGIGFRDGLAMRHIAVGHDEKGRPLIEVTGRAEELCRELGIGARHLSLSDEHEYAVAFVTLLSAQTPNI